MAYRNISVWLEDILNAIERIDEYRKNLQSYKEFLKEEIIVDATERNLEVIAEALKKALQINAQLPISHVRKIIGLRNIINHEYYEVEYDKLWIIIIKDLPILKAEVKEILEDYERKLNLNEL